MVAPMKNGLKYLFLFAALLCLVVQAGCGAKMSKAEGTLKVDGKTVGNATITFYPVSGGRPGSAFVKEDGTFVVSYLKPGDGLPPGEYKVAIIADQLGAVESQAGEAGSEQGFADARDVIKLVPIEYNSIQTTPLRVTVTDSAKVLELDISTK